MGARESMRKTTRIHKPRLVRPGGADKPFMRWLENEFANFSYMVLISFMTAVSVSVPVFNCAYPDADLGEVPPLSRSHSSFTANSMKLDVNGDTLRISAVNQLGAANANSFRDWVREALSDGEKNLDIDLSQMTFLDSCGLGALVALHKLVRNRSGTLRLLHPQPPVQQILELTRMDQLFEVVKA